MTGTKERTQADNGRAYVERAVAQFRSYNVGVDGLESRGRYKVSATERICAVWSNSPIGMLPKNVILPASVYTYGCPHVVIMGAEYHKGCPHDIKYCDLRIVI